MGSLMAESRSDLKCSSIRFFICPGPVERKVVACYNKCVIFCIISINITDTLIYSIYRSYYVIMNYRKQAYRNFVSFIDKSVMEDS